MEMILEIVAYGLEVVYIPNLRRHSYDEQKQKKRANASYITYTKRKPQEKMFTFIQRYSSFKCMEKSWITALLLVYFTKQKFGTIFNLFGDGISILVQGNDFQSSFRYFSMYFTRYQNNVKLKKIILRYQIIATN